MLAGGTGDLPSLLHYRRNDFLCSFKRFYQRPSIHIDPPIQLSPRWKSIEALRQGCSISGDLCDIQESLDDHRTWASWISFLLPTCFFAGSLGAREGTYGQAYFQLSAP